MQAEVLLLFPGVSFSSLSLSLINGEVHSRVIKLRILNILIVLKCSKFYDPAWTFHLQFITVVLGALLKKHANKLVSQKRPKVAKHNIYYITAYYVNVKIFIVFATHYTHIPGHDIKGQKQNSKEMKYVARQHLCFPFQKWDVLRDLWWTRWYVPVTFCWLSSWVMRHSVLGCHVTEIRWFA